MSDSNGDQSKRTVDCKDQTEAGCPNMREVHGNMEKEVYECAVCSARYTLYYSEMT